MGTETHRHGEGQVRTEACASCYRLWPSSWRFLRMARETAGRVFPPLRSPSVGSLGSRVTLSRWCPSPPPRAHHSWGWLPAPAEGLLAAQHGVRCGLGPWLCPCMYQDSPRSMVTLSSSSEPVEGPPSSCWFALLGHRCPESTNVAEGGALSHLPSCSARVPGGAPGASALPEPAWAVEEGAGLHRAGLGSLVVNPGLVTKADGERGWLPKPLEAQECGEGSSWSQVLWSWGEFAFISRQRPHRETFYGLADAPGPERFHQAACQGHWPAGRDHGALPRVKSARGGSAGWWGTKAEAGCGGTATPPLCTVCNRA